MHRDEFFRDARHDRTGPLHGLRVLEATTAWAGPMVGCVLGDLGADVVRIDLPDGPGPSYWPPFLPGTTLALSHETVNRNKRSITLDLRAPAGRDLFLELVRTADLVVENFKPGTLDGWGVGYRGCTQVKPDLVYVSVSGWGQYGPWADRPGYDPAALAAGGWMSLNGAPDGEPTKAPTFLADDLAGLHAVIGALAALRHRDETGEGQHVDVSLLDALLFQSNGHLTAAASDMPLRRWGSEVHASVPTNAYHCTDGQVYIAMVLDSHWRTLCTVMERPDLATAAGTATNVERVGSRQLVNAAVAGWCATRSRDEVVDTLSAAGLVVAPVSTYAEAAATEQVRVRDMLVDTVLSDGSVAPLTAPAAKFSRTPTTVRRAAPRPGAHTVEVLDAAGLLAHRPGERERVR